jgi:hypothetical protein
MTPVHRGAVAASAFLVMLAGCGGPAPETDTPSPPPSATAPTSATPTSASPTVPEPTSASTVQPAGDDRPLRDRMVAPVPPTHTKDDAGAVAFVKYYVDVLDWVLASRDASGFDDVCLPANVQCERLRSSVEYLRRENATQYGGRTTAAIASGLTVSNPGANVKVVRTRVLIEPADIRDSSGTVLDSRGAYDMVVDFRMEWNGSRWRMADATRVDG